MADDANWPGHSGGAAADTLAPGEQLLLSGLRLWASLRLADEAPQSAVRGLIATEVSDRAGAIFVALMESLERQTVRPLEVRCPGRQTCGLDEQRIIVACGVARVDMSLARGLLKPLVLQPEPVAIFARALNVVLRHEGVSLPARLCDGAPGQWSPAKLAGVTLH